MSAPAGILDSFTKLLAVSSKRDPRRGALAYILTSLGDLKTRLEEIKRRLKERDEELLASAVKSLSSGDKERATIYASEIAEVRKLMKYVHIALLAVERLLERMKTMNIVNDVRVLSTTLGILNELKNMFANTMPELASTLDGIVSNVNAIMASTQAPHFDMSVAVNTKEVEDIMREIEKQAEEKVKSLLPPLPVQLEGVVSAHSSGALVHQVANAIERRAYVEASMPTAYARRQAEQPLADSLELKIYSYVINSRGVVRIDECARLFGLSREEVIVILRRLEERGLIRIAL